MDYSVIRVELSSNRENILRLWRGSLFSVSQDASAAEAKFSWYYQSNPYGLGRCWLLRHNPSGALVGVAGLGLRRFKVGDQAIMGGLLVDFAVEQKHRVFLPALLLQKEVRQAVEQELPLLYCAPNPQATAVLLRAGYIRLGEMRRYVRILDWTPYLQRLAGSSVAARVLAKPLNWILQLMLRGNKHAGGEELVGRELEKFDARTDRLWQEASPAFSVTGERTAAFLNWRYGMFPLRRYRIFALLNRSERELLGYVIWCGVEHNAVVADIFCRDRDQEALLRRFLFFARAQGFAAVSFSLMAPASIKEVVRRVGFRQRKDTRDVILFVAPGNPSAPILLEPPNWYLVEGEQDNG